MSGKCRNRECYYHQHCKQGYYCESPGICKALCTSDSACKDSQCCAKYYSGQTYGICRDLKKPEEWCLLKVLCSLYYIKRLNYRPYHRACEQDHFRVKRERNDTAGKSLVRKIRCPVVSRYLCACPNNKNATISSILVPRAHNPSELWQGSRALAWSNTGSPRFTELTSNLANLIG